MSVRSLAMTISCSYLLKSRLYRWVCSMGSTGDGEDTRRCSECGIISIKRYITSTTYWTDQDKIGEWGRCGWRRVSISWMYFSSSWRTLQYLLYIYIFDTVAQLKDWTERCIERERGLSSRLYIFSDHYLPPVNR